MKFEIKFDMKELEMLVMTVVAILVGVYLMEEVWCEAGSAIIYATMVGIMLNKYFTYLFKKNPKMEYNKEDKD